MTAPFAADLERACSVARDAGAAILAVRTEARAAPLVKADDSPVTQADLAADRVLREGLAAAGDVVVTEETWQGGDVGSHPRAWFVDPIDGTEDFIAGRPDYAVHVGLCVAGQPTLGVIYQPATGVLWRGVVGGVCERVDADGSVHVLDVSTRNVTTPRIAVSVSHPSALVEFLVKALGGVAVRKGSVGLKVGLIVDDLADCYVTASRRIKVWDTCAPAAVLLAAGGVATALDGTPLRYDGPAAHEGGAAMWTPAGALLLAPRVDEARRRFRKATRG